MRPSALLFTNWTQPFGTLNSNFARVVFLPGFYESFTVPDNTRKRRPSMKIA